MPKVPSLPTRSCVQLGPAAARARSSVWMTSPRPVTTVRPATPYLLWNVIRQCLVKDREGRIQTASQLRSELRAVQREIDAGTVLVDRSTLPQPESPSAWRFAFPIVVAATAFLAWWTLDIDQEMPETPVRHLSLNLPPDAPLSFVPETIPTGIGRPGLALSPDRRTLAVAATNTGSNGNGKRLDKEGNYVGNHSPVHVFALPPDLA